MTLNIETKVEAGAPEETQPRDVFVPAVVSEIEEHGMVEQSTIQSFDWGALQMVAELNPDLPRVALTNYDFLQIGEPGASPWLGGLDADDFDGDLVAMAVELGVEAISPVHGFPQDGAIGEEDYEPYVTSAMVEDAHAAGVSVIPWTVNDTNTLRYLIETGVDGIITDRPDALRDVMSEYGIALPEPRPRGEDPAPGDDEPDDPDPAEEPTADPAGDSTDEPTQDPTQGPIGDPTEKPTEEESLTPTPGDETASEEPTPSLSHSSCGRRHR